MPLDSDVSNADAQLHVEFYEHKSDPYKGVPFVKIMVPGDKYNVFDQPVREDHKRRFPRQWLYFQMKQENGDAPPPGTTLKIWNAERPLELPDGLLEELHILKFQTVEQVAGASDAQVQRVGMGGSALREKARTYLVQRAKLANNEELIKTQKELDEMKAQIAQLLAAQGDKSVKGSDGKSSSAHATGNR